MSKRFLKHYPDTGARQRAEANYRWLASLHGPAHLPVLLAATGPDLCFEHIEGRHALRQDLTMLAAHLGDLHGAAYTAELRRAHLGQAHRTPSGCLLPAFPDRRLGAVARELNAGNVPDATLTAARAQHLIVGADGPAAFYKDANPRNFLITPAGIPVIIDFDDLTLAPFGYDLAKLTVTLAMTHGPLPPPAITQALNAYNTATRRRCRTLPAVTRDELANWTEIHHVLTSRFTADGRYPHRWDKARAG